MAVSPQSVYKISRIGELNARVEKKMVPKSEVYLKSEKK